MATIGVLEKASFENWTDQQVIDRVKIGDTALYEIIMRRHNQRLYRVARAILRDDADAEDVIQEAYVRAYQHLDQFAGLASFSIWLTRIAVNEALRRLRLRKRNQQLDDANDEQEFHMDIVETSPDPEQRASFNELGQLLEETIQSLPFQLRTVVMLRDVQELSTYETAQILEITEQNVKVRLHRGRALMRERLFARVGASGKDAFPFMGHRCDHVVIRVFARLRELSSKLD
ncbi:MAG TPA: RNA polymerase sigma factor [Acidobacteriaceae bacterium]|nr:RNA polymerase sigma factor [Acidobacteriaceae bacterium]